MIDTVIERVLNTPLRVYFHFLFILGMILNLEFHLVKYPQTNLGSYETSLVEFFFGKFEQIGPKILKVLCKI